MGAPLAHSGGHLLVVGGFTPSGDIVVNDPAGDSQEVRRVYDRAQFARAWFSGSGGAVYLIYPGGWSIPGEGSW